MAQISWLINQLSDQFASDTNLADICFIEGEQFSWSPEKRVIYYHKNADSGESLLLHEAGHAALGHSDYTADVGLLEMERAAWDKASELAKDIDLSIDKSTIEDHMDTYRDWLHARSLCPKCHSTGIQTAKKLYECVVCHKSWRVNEARSCALRRYSTKKRP